MTRKRILFTAVNTAELVDEEVQALGPKDVRIRTAFSTVSPGTEKANITGDPSVNTTAAPSAQFPRGLGYSSSGVVEEVGCEVTSVRPGDRVIPYWSKHANINVVPEGQVVRILDGKISDRTAAAMFIATFPMAAIRKTRLELGESCMVMGLGVLGQYAVRLARAAGAVPVIAVDPVAERRQQALDGGADYALDPFEEGFADRVKAITGGVNAAIEVTGQGAGLDETLDCMARFGRVALLGCTRNKNFTIDYYRKVHSPGITLIGAHTDARPAEESHPGWFTHVDDLKAVQKLYLGGRLDIDSMLGPVHQPEECREVYTDLVNNRNFPMMVQFDWSKY